MKKQLRLIPLTVLVVAMLTAGTAMLNNFNGTWKLDSAKSDLNEVSESNAFPTEMKLLKTDSTVSFERIFTSSPDPSKQVLKLDGTELVTKKGDNTTTRTLSLSKDGLVLTVKSKTHSVPSEGEPFDYTRTETYELAKDGKSLELIRVLAMPDRTETNKAYYNKEK